MSALNQKENKHNLHVTHFADKEQKNLETTTSLSTKSIILAPEANADLTSPSPITSKGAIFQESPPTFTPQQLEQSYRTTSTPENERKLPSSMEIKQTSIMESTLAQKNKSGEKASSFEKDLGPFAEHFQPPAPAQMEDPNVEATKALHDEQFEMAEEVKVSTVVHEVGANGSDDTLKLPGPELTPSKETREPRRPTVKKSASKPRVSREIAKLLQDEGAERIMQEMEGKGANRRRTATKDAFYRENRFYFHSERSTEDEDKTAKKKKKKNTEDGSDSVTAATADSFSVQPNSLQREKVVSYFVLYWRCGSQFNVISFKDNEQGGEPNPAVASPSCDGQSLPSDSSASAANTPESPSYDGINVLLSFDDI